MERWNIPELDADGAARTAGTVRGWNALALQAIGIRAHGAHAHALALLHGAIYNAWAAYDGAARQTVHGVAVRLPRAERDAASKAAAMSHAAHGVLVGLHPHARPDADARMVSLGLDPATVAAQFSPAGIGQAQAAAALDARDGPPFAPLPSEADELRTAAPQPAAAMRTLQHWYRMARHVALRDGHDDDRDVLLFVVLAHGLADAARAARDDPSVSAGCAAEVLRRFTGSDRLGAGARWTTFTQAAGAGMTNARDDAQAFGRKVGARVFDKARRYWQGKL
jgi:hypothetical protein